ncbi:MAG: hypothetical protein QOE99_2079 [Actinomycetota bacterium]|jgi:hypothetical protein|nr:hypothetical protein [Actinomycetota bacterium]
MTDEQQRPMSVHLNDHVATIECGGCGAASTFATTDRAVLLESVRGFLRDHDTCRPVADARLTVELGP